MTGWTLATYTIGLFALGAYFALVVRAIIGEHAQRRMSAAAEAVLDPDQMERLRGYIAEIDQHKRGRVESQSERWGRQRAATIAAEDDARARGHDPYTPC